MKFAIVGSRTFNNYMLLEESILQKYNLSLINEIISGGATGADTLAETFAHKFNINLIVFKPQWDIYGKKAGCIRNKDIVTNADVVIAFWDGYSKGTKNSIDIAQNFTHNQNKLIIHL